LGLTWHEHPLIHILAGIDSGTKYGRPSM
jgi:hypothetical protein